MADSINYKLLMDRDVKDRVDAVFNEHGMKIKEATTRILVAFSLLPKDLRAIMLGQLTASGESMLAARLLEHYAASVPAPVFQEIAEVDDGHVGEPAVVKATRGRRPSERTRH